MATCVVEISSLLTYKALTKSILNVFPSKNCTYLLCAKLSSNWILQSERGAAIQSFHNIYRALGVVVPGASG